MPQFRTPQGAIVVVPDDQADSAEASGYKPVGIDQAGSVNSARESEDRGALGGINAAATGFLSGATLGGSDYLLKGLLDQGQFERLAQEREGHPIASGIGQVAGAVLPAFGAPESLLGRMPAGIVGHATAGAVAEGRAIGGAAGVARQLVAGGVEGAIQNAGMYLSDTALGDRELSAEGLAGALGPGFAFGVGGGAAALGIEQGTIAARRLFSRAAGTDKAAEAAKSAWLADYQSHVEATSAAADIARAKLADAQAARQAAGLAKQRAGLAATEAKIAAPEIEAARAQASALDAKAAKIGAQELEGVAPIAPMAPAATEWTPPPPFLTAEEAAAQRYSILSEANEKELAESLAEHGAAHDELENMLKRLELPDLEPGAYPSHVVPLEDWGGPNRLGALGTPGPHAPVKMSPTGELPPLPLAGDKTTAFDSKDLGLTFDPKTRTYHDAEGAAGRAAAEAEKFAPSEPGTLVRDRPSAPVEVPPARPITSQKEFRAVQDAFREKLTPEEIKQSLRYTREDYNDVNRFLRGDKRVPKLGDREAEIISAMDAILEKGATTETMVTHRAVHFDPGEAGHSLKPGDVWTDPAYQSTSYREDNIGRFGNTKFVITSPPGTKIAPIPSAAGEGEFLLARDSKLRITSRSEEGGKITYHATVEPRIPSESSQPTGLESLVDMQRRAGQATNAGAADTLTGQMRSMQERLAAGGGLKELGAPARAEYAAAKAVKTEEAAQHFRAEALGKREFRKIPDDDYAAQRKTFESKITPDESSAVDTYASSVYKDINRMLRHGEVRNGREKLIDRIDAALAKSSLHDNAKLYRGLSGEEAKGFRKLEIGDSFEEKAFSSTSSSPDVFKRDVNLHIDVPAGYEAAPIPSRIDEKEWLLRRNTRYVVTGIEEDGAARTIHVRVVDSPSPRPVAEMVSDKTGRLPDAPPLAFTKGATPSGQPSLGAPATFGERFDEAFHRIDKASGRHDYVKLSDLRRELSDVSSEDFNSALREMRKSKHFSLDSEDGRQVRMSDEERAAGIKEAGSNLVYAQRGEKYKPIYKPKAAVAEKLKAAPVVAASNSQGDIDKFFANMTRPKTRDAYVAQNIGRAMREEGSHAKALAKVEREWGAQSGHPLAAQQLEAAHEAAVQRASAAQSPLEQLTAEREVRAIERQMTAVGARPGAVEDVAALAGVATKYEKASARLTEALGPSAPPAAQEAAKAFRAAEDASERKAMDRTTRAIDDHAEAKAKRPDVVVTKTTGPKPATIQREKFPGETDDVLFVTPDGRAVPKSATAARPTAKQTIETAKAEKLKAGAALERARIAETEAKIGVRGADEAAAKVRGMTAPAGAPTEEAGKMSRLGAIATTIGVAGELGVPGLPHPSDIPVIGPLLGAYLKYRAIKAAAGRFVGRIPATGDARAAALVAKTKDRLAKAVDRTLGLAEKTAPKARGALVASAAALGHRIFDDGEPDAPKGATVQQQAAVRIREITNAATRPDLVTALVRKELRGVTDPDLIAAAEQHLLARFQYLNGVMPKQPPPNPYTKREWVPSPAAANEVAQRLAVVHDPEAALADPTPAKVDTVRNVYPRLLQLAQERLTERISDATAPVPYQQRLKSSLLFGVQLDDSLDPQAIATYQSAHAANRATPTPQPAAPPTSSVAADTNLNAMYQTGMDRRAMR